MSERHIIQIAVAITGGVVGFALIKTFTEQIIGERVPVLNIAGFFAGAVVGYVVINKKTDLI